MVWQGKWKRPVAGQLILVAGFCVLYSSTAAGDVSGFVINKVDGLGDLEGNLDDRLSDDLVLNYEDCLFYLGYDDYGEIAAEITPKIMIRWSLSSLAGDTYAVKLGSCSTSADISDEETDSCVYLVTSTDLDGYTNNELYVKLTDLIGDTCEEGDVDDTALYFFVQEEDYDDTTTVETVRIYWDYEAPVAPTEVTATVGESNLEVAWTDESNSEDVTYNVYWGPMPYDETAVSSKLDLTAQEYTITGLENGVEYWVGITSVDDYANESDLSEVTYGIPVEVDDFWEYYKESGGGETGGFCFVATATYGSTMAPDVQVLRRFRDTRMLTTPQGRGMVGLYYRFGPYAAEWIRHDESLKALSRVFLKPLVGLAELTTE